MAGPFAITVPTSSATVAAGEAKNFTFTIANSGDKTVQALATVKARKPAERPWFSISGPSVVAFEAGSTKQIVVVFKPPPETAPLEKSEFQLVVADNAHTDDVFNESAWVSVRLTAAAVVPIQKKRKFPWWLVIAGAALLTGFAVFLICWLTKLPDEGEACDDGRCAKALSCTNGICRSPGTCASDADCKNGSCLNEKCLGAKGHECQADDQCLSGKCESARCTGIGPGGACASAAQCASPNEDCVGGKCTCRTGRGDCDGNRFNGCETNLEATPQHCGACGKSCGSGRCGKSIVTSQFPSEDWKPYGSTTFAQGSAVLTQKLREEAGSIVYARGIVVDASFKLEFQFEIASSEGVFGHQGDAGMAFMMANDQGNIRYLGHGGQGLGVAGLKGFGVELDTYGNPGCGDIGDDHVAIISLDACFEQPTTLGQAFPIPLRNRSGTMRIELTNGELSASLNRSGTKAALPGFQPGVYRFGFAAGTGRVELPLHGSGSRHAVRDVKLSFDSVRCL
ncbi:MAG TPA: L-type lectin-domain containing protein [Burkholderiales bacterium]|nr:L-type lectin-domain containing protein [Burkholderiales bacterium]